MSEQQKSENQQPLHWEVITLNDLILNEQNQNEQNQNDWQPQYLKPQQEKFLHQESSDLKSIDDTSYTKKLLNDKWYNTERIIGDLIDIYEETELIDAKDIAKYNARFRMITKIAELSWLIKRNDNRPGVTVNLLTLLKK